MKKLLLFSVFTMSLGINQMNGQAKKIAIYRWNHGNDWADAREDETPNMEKWGYINKTFVCYLYTEPMNGTIGISRWLLPSPEDWVTAREDESDNLNKWGYKSKILLGYVFQNPRSNTMPISRWNLEKTGDWVTVPETSSAKMQEFGYVSKVLIGYTPK